MHLIGFIIRIYFLGFFKLQLLSGRPGEQYIPVTVIIGN